ncbi:hypothetical protein GCM10009634_84330 [Saccharothrix xinjiangensis]
MQDVLAPVQVLPGGLGEPRLPEQLDGFGPGGVLRAHGRTTSGGTGSAPYRGTGWSERRLGYQTGLTGALPPPVAST